MDADQPFAEWLHDQVVAAGYDLSTQRAGGRSKLATVAGVSLSQVQRALGGKSTPDIGTQRALCRALDIPLKTMLIRSRTLLASDFDVTEATAKEDARALGLRLGVDPAKLDQWIAIVGAVAGVFSNPTGK